MNKLPPTFSRTGCDCEKRINSQARRIEPNRFQKSPIEKRTLSPSNTSSFLPSMRQRKWQWPQLFCLLFCLLFSLPPPPAAAASLSVGRGGMEDSQPSVSREFLPFDGDVAWVVQISDLHISSYYPDRADDLRRLLVPALRAIRPSAVLITGDLTVRE
ncbi:hypothetical protein ACLOJK_007299 [Asimina triloba]